MLRPATPVSSTTHPSTPLATEHTGVTSRARSLLAVRILGAGALLTLALLSFECVLVVRLYNAFRDLTTSEVHLQELRGEVQYLDEVLTSSARMAAATGDLTWRVRYDQHQPILAERIEEMLALTRDPFERAAGQRISAAHARLVAMEREAFALIAQGRAPAARALLEGGQYTRNKQQYAEGMNEGATAISDRLAGLRGEYGRRVVAVLVLTVLSLAFLISAWIGAIVLVRRHLAVLADAADAAALQRMVFDSTRDCIVLFDPAGVIVAANPAVTLILGHAADSLIGKPIDQTLIRSGLTPEPSETPQPLAVSAADGSDVPVEATVSRSTMGAGKTVYAAVLRDHRERDLADRERKRLEAELRQAQKMEALGTLAGGIAHDFSNLLAAITGFAENARASLPEHHRAHAALARLDEAVTHATGMTRSLLTFCRTAPAARTPLALRRVVHDTARLIAPLLPKRIECLFDVPATSASSTWAMGDPAQLRQVVVNLCLNARDAMPGGGTLTVSLDADDAQVRLSVRDTGEGMTDETRARVFEPFFTTKDAGEGTGLGLAVLHGIVIDHGGTAAVDSTEGHGTEFIVTLPSIDPPKAPPATSAQGLRVMLAIEDHYERAILASSLRREGHIVLTTVPRSDDKPSADLCITDGAADAATPAENRVPTLVLADTVHEGVGDAAAVVARPYSIGDVLAAVERVLPAE